MKGVELYGQVRRAVYVEGMSRREAARRFGIDPPWTFFGTLLLICGAMFLLIGVANLRQERAFRAEGKTATAIVLTKSSHQEYYQQNDTYQTHYDLDYRFTTDDGKSARGSAEVNWRTWRSINERDPIQIIYLPMRPTRSRLASDHPGFFLWFVTVLGAMLTRWNNFARLWTVRRSPEAEEVMKTTSRSSTFWWTVVFLIAVIAPTRAFAAGAPTPAPTPAGPSYFITWRGTASDSIKWSESSGAPPGVLPYMKNDWEERALIW